LEAGRVAQRIFAALQLYADGLDEFYEQLAHHYERAGAAEPALTYLVRAAEKAVEQNALQQAVGFYGRALTLAPPGQQDDLRARRATAHLELYNGHGAAADYEALLAAARRVGDRPRELAAMMGLGRALYVVSLDAGGGDAVERSRRLYEEAHELARQLGDTRAMVRALLGTQWLTDTWPQYRDRVFANAQEALGLSQQIGDDDLRIESETVLLRMVRREEAVPIEERLLAELERRRDLPRLNLALFSALARWMAWGDFREGVARAERATGVAAELGVPPVQYASFGAVCLIGLGRYDEAWAWLRREVADEEHPFGRAVRDLVRGHFLVEVFADQRALDLLTDVAERGRTLRRAWMVEWAEAMRGLALARLGRGREIDWTRLDVAPDRVSTTRVGAAGAEIALVTEPPDEALRRAREVADLAAVQDAAAERAAALAVAARALAALGRHDESIAATDEALETAEAKGYRPLVWRLRATRARALAELGRIGEAEADYAAARATIEGWPG
jgi:tetratricopeptide (TPR) repeat protein